MRMLQKIIGFIIFFVVLTFATNTPAQQQVNIGIFSSTTTGQAEIRIQPNYADNRYLTNMQFTVRWPFASGVTIIPGALISPFSLQSQGLFLANGYYYEVFATPGGTSINWQPGVEYVCATFTYTMNSCVSFELASDSWTQANNGDYYIEINGNDMTGILYQPGLVMGNLTANPAILSDSLCEGDTTQVFAIPGCGSGNYNFQWFSPSIANPTWQSNLQNPFFVAGPQSDTLVLVIQDGTDTVTSQILLHSFARPQAFINGTDTICEGDSTTFNILLQGSPPFSFLLNLGAVSWPINGLMQNTFDVTIGNTSGTLSASSLTDMHCNGQVFGSASLIVKPLPETPVIIQNGLILSSSVIAGNQWYDNAGPILGATDQNFAPTTEGDFYDLVTLGGCSSLASNIIHFIPVGINEDAVIPMNFYIFPNPAQCGPLTIYVPLQAKGPVEISIYNVSGILVKLISIRIQPGINTSVIDLSELVPGAYMLQMNDGINRQLVKLILQ